MAAVYEAYAFLNKSLKLGLDNETLSRVEMFFKKEWLNAKGFRVSDSGVNDWEFYAYLEPRSGRVRSTKHVKTSSQKSSTIRKAAKRGPKKAAKKRGRQLANS